jgi:SAM-dependent methyltransferase
MCHTWLDSFLPDGEKFSVLLEKQVIGGGYRTDMLCPRCGSVDRERLVFLFLKSRPELLSCGRKLLHMAPENMLSQWLRSYPKLEYRSGDLTVETVDFRFNLENIPFADGSYGAVICNHVLEHVSDDLKAMREIRRILAHDGWAILQAPISLTLQSTYEDPSITSAEGRAEAFGQEDHVRIYAMDYVDRLKTAGFMVETFDWRTQPKHFGGPTNRYALLDKEILFFVRPRLS